MNVVPHMENRCLRLILFPLPLSFCDFDVTAMDPGEQGKTWRSGTGTYRFGTEQTELRWQFFSLSIWYHLEFCRFAFSSFAFWRKRRWCLSLSSRVDWTEPVASNLILVYSLNIRVPRNWKNVGEGNIHVERRQGHGREVGGNERGHFWLNRRFLTERVDLDSRVNDFVM